MGRVAQMRLDLDTEATGEVFQCPRDATPLTKPSSCEACSASLGAACTLAQSPYFVTAIRGLRTFRHLHACSGRLRLERIAGWGLHPLICGHRSQAEIFSTAEVAPPECRRHRRHGSRCRPPSAGGATKTRRTRLRKPIPRGPAYRVFPTGVCQPCPFQGGVNVAPIKFGFAELRRIQADQPGRFAQFKPTKSVAISSWAAGATSAEVDTPSSVKFRV